MREEKKLEDDETAEDEMLCDDGEENINKNIITHL